jgi:hypothetical protein
MAEVGKLGLCRLVERERKEVDASLLMCEEGAGGGMDDIDEGISAVDLRFIQVGREAREVSADTEEDEDEEEGTTDVLCVERCRDRRFVEGEAAAADDEVDVALLLPSIV